MDHVPRLGARKGLPVHANRRGALSNSPRPAGAGTAELGAAKYGTAKVLKRTARAEVPLHISGARPSWGPHPGLPWPQRPLQEDQSRYAENQPCLTVSSFSATGREVLITPLAAEEELQVPGCYPYGVRASGSDAICAAASSYGPLRRFPCLDCASDHQR